MKRYNSNVSLRLEIQQEDDEGELQKSFIWRFNPNKNCHLVKMFSLVLGISTGDGFEHQVLCSFSTLVWLATPKTFKKELGVAVYEEKKRSWTNKGSRVW